MRLVAGILLVLVFLYPSVESRQVSSDSVSVIVAIRHSNEALDWLESELQAVSDIESSRYGQYLTARQLADGLGIDSADEEKLSELLFQYLGQNQQAESHMERIQYLRSIHNYQLLGSNDYLKLENIPIQVAKAWQQMSLDQNLPKLIQAVYIDIPESEEENPATNFKYRSFQRSSSVSSGILNTEGVVGALGSPAACRSAMQIPDNEIGSDSGKTLSMVWGPGTYGYLESDLELFWYLNNVSDASLDRVVRKGDAGEPGGDNFGEASLDVDCITGIAPGATTIVYNSNSSQSTEEGLGFGYAFIDFVNELVSAPQAQIPHVLSLSLGSLSASSCNILCTNITQYNISSAECRNYMQHQRQICMLDSEDQEKRIDVDFQKLGVRGTTVLAAAGDGGSHFSFIMFDESDPIGKALNEISCGTSMPTFPASSPSVLSIGGVQWTANNGKKNENVGPSSPVAWTTGGSGFAWLFPRPSYQESVVSSYLRKHSNDPGFQPLSSFSSNGRAYPDFSFLADSVPMVDNGSPTVAGGTSASAPYSAGLFALVNDKRLVNGLPALGFVNPRLYKAASQTGSSNNSAPLFIDVTSGDSHCAINGCCSNGYGFPATQGWDAMTGFGSPLYPGLLATLGASP